ncbi:MAG: hypothetical protein HW388_1628 [Dehalococcoidia bacterium]|nr:hypothetical protein [Dehalococcoidia bacterium]
MKRRWLFITLLVGVLTLGIMGGTALAQEDGTGADTPLKSFAARVAGILGLPEAQVQDAMKQAATEMQDEAVQRKLDKLVEKGRLTLEQATEYKAWYDSRPDGMLPGFGGRGFGRGGMMRGGGHMGGGQMGGGQMGGGHGWYGEVSPPIPTPDASATSL